MIRALVCGLLLFVGCSDSGQMGGAKAGVKTNDGLKAVEKYEFAEADSFFAKAMRQDTSSADAAFGAGLSLENQLALYDALYHYHRAAALDPQYAPVYGGLTRIYRVMGAKQIAADAALQYAELSPNDLEALFLAASVLVDAQRYPEAQRVLGQAQSAGLAGDVVELIKARMAFAKRERTAAEATSSLRAEGTQARQAYADLLEAVGMADSSVAVSRGMVEDDGSNATLIDYFFRAVRQGYLNDARLAVAEMKDRDKTGNMEVVARALYYEAARNRIRAQQAASEVAEHFPFMLSSPGFISDISARMGDLEASGIAGEEIGQMLPGWKAERALADFVQFRRIVSRGKIVMPIALLEALDSIITPSVRNEPEYVAFRAFAISEAKDYGDTLHSFEKFTAEWNTDANRWVDYAATRMGLSQVRARVAETLLVRVFEMDTKNQRAFDSLVSARMFLQDFGGAITLCEQHPELAKAHPVAAMTYSLALAEAGRADNALSVALETLPQIKGNYVLLDRLFSSFFKRGATSQAQALAAKLIELDKKNPDLVALAARVACQAGDCRRALELVNEGLKLDPSHAALLAEQGRATYALGKTEDGIKMLRAVCSKDLGNTYAQLYVSRMMAETKQEINIAQDFGRQAKMSGLLYHRAYVNLAWVYLLTDRADLARGEARQAIKIDPTDSEAYYLLGKANFVKKDPEAREALTKAISLGLFGEPLQDAQAILQQI